MRPARWIMSSPSCASSATTQCTPQSSASFRATTALGVMATIGQRGRSRATRIAVEPELVQQIMAGRCSVSAICRAAIMSKIEKPQAIERLEAIMDASDAIMVARGDLGVEMPVERVPGLQKQMPRMARRKGKPVIIATQMLESMIASPEPTRAEVSDVATAVFEGADAVMLSAESAAGKYPSDAVMMMDHIGEEVERDPTFSSVIDGQRPAPEATAGDAIADAARQLAETLHLPAIICWTSSGSTALRVARERPKPPIVAITPNAVVARKLALLW